MQVQHPVDSILGRPDGHSSLAAGPDAADTTARAFSSPSTESKSKDGTQAQPPLPVDHSYQQELGDQQLPSAMQDHKPATHKPAPAPAAATGDGALAAHVDILAAGRELLAAAGLAGDAAEDEQQVKRRRLDGQAPAQHDTVIDAVAGDDVELLPDLSMVEALAAQIDALSKKVDSAKAAVAARAPITAAGAGTVSRGTSSDSPVLPSMQEQEPHHSKRSLAFSEDAPDAPAGDAAAAVPAQAVAVGQPDADAVVLSAHVLQQQEDSMTHYARLKAKAELEAARAAKAARHADSALVAAAAADKATATRAHEWQISSYGSGPQQQASVHVGMPDASDEDEQMRGRPGYVPKWLREWRPKARAAAAAARAKEQRRKAAAAAAAAAAHRHSSLPPVLHPQHKAKKAAKAGGEPGAHGAGQLKHSTQQASGTHSDGQQHHKHLGILLDCLMEDDNAVTSPDNHGRNTPAAVAAMAAASAAAAADAAQAAEVAQRHEELIIPSFVFNAKMLLPPQPGSRSTGDGDGDGSGPESPEVPPGALNGDLTRLMSSSAEPELPQFAAQVAHQQQQQKVEREGRSSSSREGSTIFALPKRDWQKLSAAAGLTQMMQRQQHLQEQHEAEQKRHMQQLALQARIKAGCSNAHLARAVQSYRGVFAVEGTNTFEVRMYRSKLGKVLRLKNHTDAIAAARAFDRAALCLARAAMGSKSPELNFPAEEYEGERLPDLRGKGPGEIREILAKTFSGTAPQFANQHFSAVSMPAWPDRDNSSMPAWSNSNNSDTQLPAPQPQQLQQWLPQGCVVPAVEQQQQAEDLHWGSKKARSPISPKKQGQNVQKQRGVQAGCAALMTAGIKSYEAHPAAYPGGAWHPAAAAAGAVGTAPVAHTGAAAAAAAAPAQARPAAPLGVVRKLQQHKPPHQKPKGPRHGRPMIFDPMLMDAPHVAPAQARLQQQPQQSGESAMLAKMLGDLQKMSSHCYRVETCLRQFRHELTDDSAAAEAAAVAGPTAREEVRSTLAAVDACLTQEAAVQKLLAETMQLLQPALSDEERQRLQRNSVQLAPSFDALAMTLSDVCRAVLRAAVAQDAAACAAAAVATGAGGSSTAAAAAGVLAATSRSGLVALQQAVAPSLDSIPAGSARATRMARLSRAIRASQDSMVAAKKVLSGQE